MQALQPSLSQVWRTVCWLFFGAIIAGGWPAGAAQAAEPVLILQANQGWCPITDPTIGVRGTGFPPGEKIILRTGHRRTMSLNPTAAFATVAADGTMTARISLHPCDRNEPEGSVYSVDAVTDTRYTPSTPTRSLAAARFTVSYAAPPVPEQPVLPSLPSTGGSGGGASGLQSLLLVGVSVVLFGMIAAGRRRL
jgi:hypothetical protein